MTARDVGLLIVLCLLVSVTSLAQGLPVPLRYEDVIRTLQLIFVALMLFGSERDGGTRISAPRVAGWALLAWIVVSTASVVMALHPAAAIVRQAEWYSHLLFGLMLWHYLRKNPWSLRYVLWLVPLGFFLTALFEVLFWIQLEEPRLFDWCNAIPFFGHLRHFGYYALAGFVFSLAPIVLPTEARMWRRIALAAAALTVCWSFLFWTGGRAAIGSAFVATLVIAGVTRGRTGLLVLAAGFATALLGLWISTFFTVESVCAGIPHVVERTFGSSFLSGRLKIWRSALEPIEGARWLIGLGPNAYAFLPGKAYGVHPHSVLVQFVSDWGVAGTTAFLAMLAAVGWIAWVRLRADRDPFRTGMRVLAVALIVAYTVHSLVDGLYYHAQPLLTLAVMSAISVLPDDRTPHRGTPSMVLARLTGRRILQVLAVLLALLFVLSSRFLSRLLY